MTGIYMIKCLSNGKKYIGKATDLLSRERQHFSKLSVGNHPCMEMQNDYNQYGNENFVFEVLEQCSEDKLNHLEDYYILSNHTIENGYNSKRGDVVSLKGDDFENYSDDNVENLWIRELELVNEQPTQYTKLMCLQTYIYELNMLSGLNYPVEKYIHYIKSRNTKFYVQTNKLSGCEWETISIENVLKFYDRYFIYVGNAKIPKSYQDYKEEQFANLKRELFKTIDMVVNPDMRYEKNITLDEAMALHPNMCKNIILIQTDESFKNKTGTFFKDVGFNDDEDNDITSSLVELLSSEDLEMEVIRLFLMAIERKMQLTLNDIIGCNLAECVQMFN